MKTTSTGFEILARTRTWCLFILLLPAPLFAIDLDFGESEVEGNFDTTISLGASVRTEDADGVLIGKENGGSANSVNGDDGNLNYDQWDFTSAVAKVTHELEVSYKNFSMFARGFYFYDTAIMDQTTERTDLSSSAERYLGADGRLLDLYLNADFEVGEQSRLSVRGGNVVLNWGESTFIQNGINTISPVDVSKLRVAGAEVRDALTPIPLIDLTFALNDRFSFESFYQFEWDNTEIEPAGTFFSTNDFAGPGGNTVLLGFGAPGIKDNPPTVGANPPVGSAVSRIDDRDASDSGQFGLALRYFEPNLNDTEFGFYWTRLHSRLPIISAQTGSIAGLVGGNYAQSANYFREFPEDIDTLGSSFNTQLGTSGLALQGEFGYKIDQPLQVDDVELLFAALSPLNPVFGQNQVGVFGFDEEISGARRKDVMQGALSLSQILGPNLGADQITLVGEIGGTYIVDMESNDELRYEAAGTYTSGNPFFTQVGLQPETESNGFADEFSWGYRLLARLDYDNAIGAVSLQPQLAFSHDRGTTPAPLANFVNDRKIITATITASYLNAYRLALSYSNSFGGDRYNLLRDRDFLSLVASYSF